MTGYARTAAVAATAMMLTAAGAAAEPAARHDLSQECEVALALSALPSRLRGQADVYALQDGRYEKVVDADGPFSCLVERSHASSIAPQCMDAEGARTILPALIAQSEAAIRIPSAREAAAHHAAVLAEGDFSAPGRPGISYMMSNYNYIYAPSADAVLKIPPHVMFYAPSLTNEDVGGSLRSTVANIGTPFIINPGPHGYMISYTEHASDSVDVAAACAGQLGDPPPPFSPFPQEQ